MKTPLRLQAIFMSLMALALPPFAHSQAGAPAPGLAFAPVIYGVASVNGAFGGVATVMRAPSAVATDVFGNVYIADTNADIIRLVDPTGTSKIIAGTGGFPANGTNGDNGPAIAATMGLPNGLATDLAGNLYISDSANFAVRKVNKAGIITTYAGGHGAGFTGDGGLATSAQVAPSALATDKLGNLYIVDIACDCVRVVNPTGTISTIAGGGNIVASDGGQAITAALNNPTGLAVDALGNLYIADSGTRSVRKVDSLGVITTFAGSGFPGSGGDGGPAALATLRAPSALAIDSSGNLFIADAGGSANVRMVNPSGIISTIAGYEYSTTPFDDGWPANRVDMAEPKGIAADPNGNLFIVVPELDRAYEVVMHPERFPQTLIGQTSRNQRLALINSRQTELTVNSVVFHGDFHASLNPDASPQPCNPLTPLGANQNGWCTIDVVFTPTAEGIRSFPIDIHDDGNLGFLSETLTSSGLGGALAMNTGQMFVVGGDHLSDGYRGEGGPATLAQIETLYGLTVDSTGNIYFSESGNCQIRRIDGNTGILTTIAGIDPQNCDEEYIAGDGGPATAAVVISPGDLALDAHNNLYFGDGEDGRIRMIDTTGVIHTVAGLGIGIDFRPSCHYTADGGLASKAFLCGPENLIFDKNGNLFFTERNNEIVRKIDTAGILTTVAGNFSLGAGFSGDGGLATAARLNNPQGLAVDTAGNLFISDTNNEVIRKVDAITGKISTIAGEPGISGLSGDGGLALKATLNGPEGLTIDAAGDIFFADRNNSLVRKVDPAGYITTVAGNRNIGQGYNGDRLLATDTSLSFPNNTFVGPSGYLYIADTTNEVIRELTPNGMLLFPTEKVGTTSNPQAVTLSNVGNMPLHFDSQFPTGISGDFATASGGTCDFTSALAVGASCTTNLTFTPTDSGPRYGIFRFYDDGAPTSQLVGLSGTGTAQQPQVITFGNISAHIYGDRSFNLTAVATSGLPVTFTVQSGNATIVGTTITITGAGTIVVVANQAGNDAWLPAPPVTRSFTVRAVTLNVTAQDKTSEAGLALQPLTYTITGFVNNDPATVVSGAPVLSTTATPNTITNFPITLMLGTLSAANYTFNLVPGTYSVTPAPRVPDGVVKLATTSTITRSDNLYHVVITVANQGTATAQNVVLTSVKVGASVGAPAPQSMGNIPAGGSATAIVSFSPAAGVAATATVEQIVGAYTGGTFGGSYRVTLP